jgi:hypothetical protein
VDPFDAVASGDQREVDVVRVLAEPQALVVEQHLDTGVPGDPLAQDASTAGATRVAAERAR